MYNIELKDLNLQNAQTQVLQACENICDEFQMEEQFGILSFGLHELISLLERCSPSQSESFSINFYIETERVSVQVLGHSGLQTVSSQIAEATLEDADTTAFTVRSLVDNCELRNEGRELWMDIQATPVFSTPDRTSVLIKETVRKEQNALR